jgi:hypothetical protein
VDAEGVALEHSAGYQLHATRFLGLAIRFAEMNHCPIPETWRDKLAKAQIHSRLLARPDGSLPVFGNTDAGANTDHVAGPVNQAPEGGAQAGSRPHASIFPVSGYAVWWSAPATPGAGQPMSQTVVAWSFFQGHGHKLADEMSVNLWANGRPWITNTGYWPYGVDGRTATNGWRGSNAPHLVGEAEHSERSTRLLSHGDGKALRVVDLERTLKMEKVRLRRQVLQIGSDTWVVLDDAAGPNTVGVDRLWTGNPYLRAEYSGENSVLLVAPGTTAAMRLSFVSDTRMAVEEIRGKMQPFGGWVVTDGLPRAAHAFQVRQPEGEGWVMSVFEAGQTPGLRSRSLPRMDRYDGPERWSLILPEGGDRWRRVTRDAQNVVLEESDAHAPAEHVALVLPENPQGTRDEIRAAFEKAAEKFPQFRDHMEYRIPISLLMLIAFVLQELALLIIRSLRPAWTAPLRAVSTAGWLGGGAWTAFVYLNT